MTEEIKDLSFKERWPLLRKTVIKIYKTWGVIALVLAIIGVGLFFLGGNPTTSSTVTSTAGNIKTTRVTTTTVNTLYKAIDDYIFWGLYGSGLFLLLTAFFLWRSWFSGETHLNSETEVEE